MAATATDTPDAAERGLSSAEAAKRLRKLGDPPDTSSRSVSSIVAGNVFTLFNAIIGVFFVLILSLGLIADAVFGVIAIVNSYIGIRQELKAKRTLDELAVLVAPHAKAIRDGAVVSLLAEEVVPGDVIAIEPGDQLVADGEDDRQPRHDPRRVDADRRGRRGPQGRRRPGALGLLLHLRLRPLPGRRGARGELRGQAGGRGEGLPPPALAAAGRGQPGDRRLHLGDGAAGGAAPDHLPAARHRPGRGGADRDRRVW